MYFFNMKLSHLKSRGASLLLSALFFAACHEPKAPVLEAEMVVQANLDAYNTGNITEFMRYLSDSACLYEYGSSEPRACGRAALEKLYGELFNNSPELHSTIQKRICFDNKVIDHEYIVGRAGSSEALELLMIYEVENKKIAKMTVLRKKS